MLYILLPAFNEEAALGDLLPQIACLNIPYKVVLVDDGSTDGTKAVSERHSAFVPLTLLRHEQNKGLGAALSTGFKYILPILKDDDLIVTMDSDNTHPPSLIPPMLKEMELNAADMIIASRYKAGAKEIGVPRVRLLTSRGAKLLLKLFFPINDINDYTSGYRIYRGSLIKKLSDKYKDSLIKEPGFTSTFELLLKASALEPRITEYPLTLNYGKKPTKSKIRLIPTIMRYLYLMLNSARFKQTS